MIIWGGASRGRLFADGAAYNPAADRWQRLAPAPLEARTAHTSVWSGNEMIVWGGCCEPRGGEFGDGAAYDPASDTWRMLPPAPIEGRTEHAAVWSGNKMVVWGGHVFERAFADGATYNPSTERWQTIARAPIEGRFSHSAVSMGKRVVIWGGADALGAFDDGAWYEPGRDRWSVISPAPLDPRAGHSATSTGFTMAVIAGCCDSEGGEFADGALYVPTHDKWEALPTRRLEARQGHAAVWAEGPGLLVWGGRNGLDRYLADGRLFAARGLTIEPGVSAPTPVSPLSPRAGHTAVVSDGEFLVWGGCCDPDRRAYGDGAGLSTSDLVDLAEGAWTRGAGFDGQETLRPEDGDFGVGAMIALAGLIVLIALAATVRALRKREAR